MNFRCVMSISFSDQDLVFTPSDVFRSSDTQEMETSSLMDPQEDSDYFKFCQGLQPYFLDRGYEHSPLPDLRARKITSPKKKRTSQTENLPAGETKQPENLDEVRPVDKFLLDAIKVFKDKAIGQTLIPKAGVADTDSDVYFHEASGEHCDLVIKPGLRDARISVMAQEVLRIMGLESTVPAMKLGILAMIRSSQDIDLDRGVEKKYVIMLDNADQAFAIEKEMLIPVDSLTMPEDGKLLQDPHSDKWLKVRWDDKKNVFIDIYINDFDDGDHSDDENDDIENCSFIGNRDVENRSFCSIESDSSCNNSLGSSDIWISEFTNTPFKLVHDTDASEYYLAPETAMFSIKSNGSKNYVTRHNFLYELIKNDLENSFSVLGRNVPSLYQKLISPRYIGQRSDGLDVTKASEERDLFYGRINRHSFIESFVSYILTRSQDGKIEKLKSDSNFLFEQMENGELKVVQIDLDNVMPTSNHPKDDRTPHPLRCGLMGFPIVDEVMFGEEFEFLKEILERCVSKENEEKAIKQIRMFGKSRDDIRSAAMTKERIKAYQEVLMGIRSFLEKSLSEDVTLKGLFYHIFPSYKRHFEMLVTGTDRVNRISSQLAALQVGAEPISLLFDRRR